MTTLNIRHILICAEKEKRKKLQRRTQFNSQDFPMFNASAKRAAAAKANTHQVFFLSTSEQISYEIPQSLPHFFISLEKRSHWRMFHCRNGFKCNLNEPHICLPDIFFLPLIISSFLCQQRRLTMLICNRPFTRHRALLRTGVCEREREKGEG